MKMPKHVSPSSFACWKSNREEYYLRYLADQPVPRFPQTEAMAVGSAFDAYIKFHLGTRCGVIGDLTFDSLFEEQVEDQNRDFALRAGKDVFDQYIRSSAYERLCKGLDKASSVNLVFDRWGTVKDVSGVPVNGIPDLMYRVGGVTVIEDWKVNGYCGSSVTRAKAGYLYHGGVTHKNAVPAFHEGVEYNCTPNMVGTDWAIQLCMYGWVYVVPGTEFMIGVQQLVCNNKQVVVAEHRHFLESSFQESLLAELKEMWATIESGWIFRDMTEEESKGRQTILDQHATGLQDPFMKMISGRK